VEILRRTVPQETIRKAITLLLFSMLFVSVFTALLLYTERKPLTDVLFESVSAFGTVGLSTGITPALSMRGKMLITLLMFVGRLGPLTLGYAFATHRRRTRYVYPDERVMIG
jgi:trk system potassium uptake protein TrkH